MRFDTKIAIAVRDDLVPWQALNVTAFLASGVAGATPALVGQPYADGSGNAYLALFRQPVLIYAAGADQLRTAHARALARGLPTAVYTEGMFRTGNDVDNRAAVAAVGAAELNLVGLALHAPRSEVDRVMKGMRLHP